MTGSLPLAAPLDEWRTLPFERNFVGGRWQFPRAPYEFEIRSPLDSTVTAVVPLSSRFDVDDAVTAASAALAGPWDDPITRRRSIALLLESLRSAIDSLARLQSVETGLDLADSVAGIDTALAALDSAAVTSGVERRAVVSGHILSWGQPLVEVMTSVLPALAAGSTAVVKPALAAPLSAVGFAQVAAECGLPPGVLNVVHGTGPDVGAALAGSPRLGWVSARASERTLAAVSRAGRRTGVPRHLLSGGGNVFVVGPRNVDIGALVSAVAAATRMHAGPFGVPVLAVHREAADAVDAIVDGLSGITAAPLATGFQRERALRRVNDLVSSGARLLLGGTIPDDVEHRMGWRLPPVVAHLEGLGDEAAGRILRADPIGPVVSVLPFTTWPELGARLVGARYRSGVVTTWGTPPPREITERFGRVVTASTCFTYPGDVGLAPAWTARP